MAIRELPSYTSKRTDYLYVEDVAQFVRWFKSQDIKLTAVDTETYFDPVLAQEHGVVTKWIKGSPNNRPFGVSLYYRVPGGNWEQGAWIDHDLELLVPILEDDSIAKIFHNSKYDLNMLANIGLDVKGQIWDTMIMMQLIDEEFMCDLPPDENGEIKKKKSKALKNLAYHFLKGDAHEYEDLVHEYRKIIAANTGRRLEEVSYKEASDANPQLMKDYAVADTEFCFKLWPIFMEKMKEQDLMRAYDVDMNATIATVDIERQGMSVNKELMEHDQRELEKILDSARSAIFGISGSTFNINSDAELVTVFEKLGVKWEWFTEKGELCTDKKVLKKIIDLYK